MGSNAVPRLIAGAASIAALAFAADGFNSNAPNRAATMQANQWRTYEDQYINNSAVWSGNNTMDGAAINLRNVILSVQQNIRGGVEYAKAVWRDGIVRHFHLLAVGIGGAVLAIGPDNVGGFIRGAITNPGSPVRTIGSSLRGLMARAFNSGGLQRVGSWALRSVCNIIDAMGSSATSATAGVIAIGAAVFLINRFINVYSGDAMRDHFNTMVEEGTTSNLYGNPFVIQDNGFM